MSDEAGWYFGNMYGRAWWNTRRDGIELSDDLKSVIDEVIHSSPSFTNDLHHRLTEEILRLNDEKRR